jgi:hypothetical protein
MIWSVKEVPFIELECELNAFTEQGYEIYRLFRYTWQNGSYFQIVARKPCNKMEVPVTHFNTARDIIYAVDLDPADQGSLLKNITAALANVEREAWKDAAKIAREMPTLDGEQKRMTMTIVQVCEQRQKAVVS